MTGAKILGAGLLVPAMLLAGCGDLDNTRTGLGGRLVTGLLSPQAPAPAPLTRPGFTAAEIGANPDAFVLMTINAMGVQEPARRIAAEGTDETYEFESGFTAAFEDGMLVATHGLGFDLIAADGAETRAALRQGGGVASRSIEVMDSLDQLARVDFRCTIAPAGEEAVNLGARTVTLRKFTENCVSDRLIFESSYWFDAAGSMLASEQYVSPTVAYLRSNRL